ncbi:MAG: hypothetical protein KGQ87_03760 [Verrucomicrobia bacterium]|nr:hypothetical protein [Verrucomicrobiota bacterium]
MKNIPLIRHESWNSLVDTISRRLPLRFEVGPNPRKWSHPWKISPFWEAGDEEKGTKGQWLFKIKPGFVNGVEVTVPTRVKHTAERTITRLSEAKEDIKDPERMVDAFLTEWPRVEIGPTRVIGTGADPSGTSSGGNIKLSYEPVPKFFADLGVTSANTQISGNINSGITFIDGQEDAKKARRLRACDVSLWKDRPSAKFEVDPGNILAGIVGSIYITYSHLGGMKKHPYLRVSSKFVPPPEPESPMALLEGITDPEYDLTKIATIFLVSQPGAEPAAPLDSSWTPYVEYNQFWNLAHSPQSIPDSTPIDPIRLTTGLAGGLADILISTLLAPLNAQLNNALQILKSRNMSGRFWSL